MLHCKLLRSPRPARADRRRSTPRAAAGAPGREPGPDRATDFPDPVRHPPGQPGRARALLDKVRFVGDPVAAVVGRDEDTAAEALRPRSTSTYEPLRTIADPEEALAHARAAHPRLRRRRQRPQARGLRVRRRRGGAAPRPTTSSRTSSSQGNTHLPIEQHAALAAVDPDGKLDALVVDADAALRAPRAGQGARPCPPRTSASSPRPTAAASAARATPSTTRSSSPRPRC